LHRTPRLARNQRERGLKPRVRFAAISATERRNDHTHLIFRQFENLSQLLLNARRVLGSGMDY